MKCTSFYKDLTDSIKVLELKHGDIFSIREEDIADIPCGVIRNLYFLPDDEIDEYGFEKVPGYLIVKYDLGEDDNEE